MFHVWNFCQDNIYPFVIILLAKVEEVIIFVEENRFQVKLKFGERGKYISDVNTNIAWRKYNVIIRVCLLLYKISDEKEKNFCYFREIKFSLPFCLR